MFTLGRGPVTYKSKQQACVALSTCEVGYYSAAYATNAGLHLGRLMGEIFDEPIDETTTIWEDNQSAIAYSHNALVSEKTKHIDLKWHFFKAHVEQGTVRLRYTRTYRMVADMFTKPLLGPALARHRSAILGGADPMQRFIP
jgi:hypothetical protein